VADGGRSPKGDDAVPILDSNEPLGVSRYRGEGRRRARGRFLLSVNGSPVAGRTRTGGNRWIGGAMFDPVQLESFLAVAQTHNFTERAALGCSNPPSASTSQAGGERRRRLFVRDTHRVTLTATARR